MQEEDQPGSVIAPGSSKQEPSWEYKPDAVPRPAQAAAPAAMAQPEHINTPGSPVPPATQQTRAQPNDALVSWTASEFIRHDKSAGWYLMLAVCTLMLSAILYFFAGKDKFSAVVIIIAAISFGIFAARKPRELQYSVDDNGLQMGEKFYPYAGFRSFSIIQEYAVESIWLMPLKRFMPPLTIYFDPKDGQKIVDVLSTFLPLENRQLDPVDRLMHRLRF